MQKLTQKDFRMPIPGRWKCFLLITSTTFCARYTEEISSLHHSSKKGRFAEVHGICFSKALTEKIGSQVLDEANIGINYVRNIYVREWKFQSKCWPRTQLFPVLILSPETKKESWKVFVPFPETGYIIYVQRKGYIWDWQRCCILQGGLG